MVVRIIHTQDFMDKFQSIRDLELSTIITTRLSRVAQGNFGDVKSIGGGLSELRIHYGAGYRIYYIMRGREIIILLCAGGKSDQKKDIKKAKILAEEYENEN